MKTRNLWQPSASRFFLRSSLCVACFVPALASATSEQWQLGAYAGKYYDSNPAGFTQGQANFLDQHLFALTAKKTVWQSASLPLALELDAMVGVQGGIATLGEAAFAPAVRWSGFPWNSLLNTSISLAPFGVSYTTSVSALERNKDGQGAQWLNWLFIEAAFASPKDKSTEFFMRLHHRCTVYDLINNYGANGEDFFALGFRMKF